MDSRFELALDYIIEQSLPYLIFTGSEFRNNLAGQLEFLIQCHIERDETRFWITNDKILELLKTKFPSVISNKVSRFRTRNLSYEDQVRQLREELQSKGFVKAEAMQQLRKEMTQLRQEVEALKPRSNAVDDSNSIKVASEIMSSMGGVGKTTLQEVISGRDEIEPPTIPEITKQTTKRKCPSCGKKMDYKLNKGGGSYHCYLSHDGCGKTYYVGDDGNFIENTKGSNNPLCPCGKGIKMGRMGKNKIDGEEYQLYRCKYTTQGGCGSEYTMDKEGNLHRGTNKSALLSPPIVPQFEPAPANPESNNKSEE